MLGAQGVFRPPAAFVGTGWPSWPFPHARRNIQRLGINRIMEVSSQVQGVFAVAAGLYLCASMGFALLARSGGRIAVRWPFVLLCAAGAFHVWLIGGQCVVGLHPFASTALFLNSLGLFVVLGYVLLAMLRQKPMRELGGMVALLGLGAVALGFTANGLIEGELLARHSAVLRWHLVLAMLGVSGFTLAAGVAMLVLVAEARLKSKKLGPGMEGLSVRGLDRLHHKMMLGVAPVFAASVILGSIALTSRGGVSMLDNRLFEIAAAGVACGSCAVSLVGRWRVGLRGRRAAWLTLLGFAFVVLILISYGVRR